jgi:hypothetical protein
MARSFDRSVLWLALLAGGCSLHSLDGLTRGNDGEPLDAASLDASALKDGAADDADLEMEDGSLVTDAGVDAKSATDAAPEGGAPSVGFCDQHQDAFFCSDLNGISLEDEFSWIETLGTPMGLVELADDPSTKPGEVLRSSLNADTEQSGRAAVELPEPPVGVEISFDFFAELPASDPDDTLIHLCKFQERTGDRYPGISISARPGMLFLVVDHFDGQTEQHFEQALAPLPVGWTRIAMHIEFGAQGRVQVSYAGAPAGQLTNVPVGSSGASQGYVMFGLYSTGTGPSTAYYDNLLVRYTP